MTALVNCGSVLLFQPGLWDAVDQDDIMSVRKLINLWCRADIKRVKQNGNPRAWLFSVSIFSAYRHPYMHQGPMNNPSRLFALGEKLTTGF